MTDDDARRDPEQRGDESGRDADDVGAMGSQDREMDPGETRREQERAADPAATGVDEDETDAEVRAGGEADAPADHVAAENMDEDLREAVTYELADLEDAADDEPDFPQMDDPVSPQNVDLENAMFVVLGFLGMIALIARMLFGLF